MGSFTLESEGGYRDVAMLEECDKAVTTVCELSGWTPELDLVAKSNEKKCSTSADSKRSKSLTSAAAKTQAANKSSRHTTAKTKTAFESTYHSKSTRK